MELKLNIDSIKQYNISEFIEKARQYSPELKIVNIAFTGGQKPCLTTLRSLQKFLEEENKDKEKEEEELRISIQDYRDFEYFKIIYSHICHAKKRISFLDIDCYWPDITLPDNVDKYRVFIHNNCMNLLQNKSFVEKIDDLTVVIESRNNNTSTVQLVDLNYCKQGARMHFYQFNLYFPKLCLRAFNKVIGLYFYFKYNTCPTELIDAFSSIHADDYKNIQGISFDILIPHNYKLLHIIMDKMISCGNIGPDVYLIIGVQLEVYLMILYLVKYLKEKEFNGSIILEHETRNTYIVCKLLIDVLKNNNENNNINISMRNRKNYPQTYDDVCLDNPLQSLKIIGV